MGWGIKLCYTDESSLSEPVRQFSEARIEVGGAYLHVFQWEMCVELNQELGAYMESHSRQPEIAKTVRRTINNIKWCAAKNHNDQSDFNQMRKLINCELHCISLIAFLNCMQSIRNWIRMLTLCVCFFSIVIYAKICNLQLKKRNPIYGTSNSLSCM